MYNFGKRIFDVGVSLTVLVVLIPLFAVIAVAIVVTMGRPVLFRQTRIGKDGRPFVLTKFRTMNTGAEADETRLTALGSFLRSTSLDELPELQHVVRGHMAIVGPRPLLPQYLGRYSARQARRHEVRPGLTGLAQVSGRNAIDWDERLELDVQYVEARSIRLDASILRRSVATVVHRDGVTATGHVTMPEFQGS